MSLRFPISLTTGVPHGVHYEYDRRTTRISNHLNELHNAGITDMVCSGGCGPTPKTRLGLPHCAGQRHYHQLPAAGGQMNIKEIILTDHNGLQTVFTEFEGLIELTDQSTAASPLPRATPCAQRRQRDSRGGGGVIVKIEVELHQINTLPIGEEVMAWYERAGGVWDYCLAENQADWELAQKICTCWARFPVPSPTPPETQKEGGE